MEAKILQNRSWRCLGRVLKPSWLQVEVLSLSWRQLWGVLARSWFQDGGFRVHLGSQMDAQIHESCSQERSERWSFFWYLCASTLEAIWCQLGSQKPPKMEPNWFQNRCKLGCWFDTCFGRDLGSIFVDFWPQHAKAGIAKIYKNRRTITKFIGFSILWLLCCWVEFVIDFWLIFWGFGDQKCIKNPSKKSSRIWCDFWCVLDGSWERFWRDFGSKLGANWDQVGAKLEPKAIKKRWWKCDALLDGFWKALGGSWMSFGSQNENIFLPPEAS